MAGNCETDAANLTTNPSAAIFPLRFPGEEAACLRVGAGLDAKLKCVDAAFLCAFYPRSGPYMCRRLSVYLHPFNVLCTISRHWHGSCSYAGACSAQTVVSSGQRCLRRSQPLNGEALMKLHICSHKALQARRSSRCTGGSRTGRHDCQRSQRLRPSKGAYRDLSRC